ncbi:MAG: hypothetical protein AB1733_00785 [Thermodesulfobacteriota bacterium]
MKRISVQSIRVKPFQISFVGTVRVVNAVRIVSPLAVKRPLSLSLKLGSSRFLGAESGSDGDSTGKHGGREGQKPRKRVTEKVPRLEGKSPILQGAVKPLSHATIRTPQSGEQPVMDQRPVESSLPAEVSAISLPHRPELKPIVDVFVVEAPVTPEAPAVTETPEVLRVPEAPIAPSAPAAPVAPQGGVAAEAPREKRSPRIRNVVKKEAEQPPPSLPPATRLKVMRRRRTEAPKVFETVTRAFPSAMLHGVKMEREEGETP